MKLVGIFFEVDTDGDGKLALGAARACTLRTATTKRGTSRGPGLHCASHRRGVSI